MTTLHDVNERLHNADRHRERLQDILTKSAPPEANQRIYRARTIVDDDYVVFTILQNLPNFTPQPGQPDVKLHVFVDRPYTRATLSQGPVVTIMLVGQYSLDEIVAFLALDRISPDSLEWVDETKYSNLVVVGDILRKLRPN